MLLKFLEKANKGISLNLCSYRLPTIVCRSDSCPHGLGVYNHLGFAWRFYLPEESPSQSNSIQESQELITLLEMNSLEMEAVAAEAEEEMERGRETMKIEKSETKLSLINSSSEQTRTTRSSQAETSRPNFNSKCKMCNKWKIHGYCFTDCQNKDSHVPHTKYIDEQKTAFGNWMAICHQAAPSAPGN
jgi:hypothetical protein